MLNSYNAVTQPPSPTELVASQTAVINDIEATSKRVVQMEATWEKTTSEMTRDLIQQQVVSDIRTTTRLVNQ